MIDPQTQIRKFARKKQWFFSIHIGLHFNFFKLRLYILDYEMSCNDMSTDQQETDQRTTTQPDTIKK